MRMHGSSPSVLTINRPPASRWVRARCHYNTVKKTTGYIDRIKIIVYIVDNRVTSRPRAVLSANSAQNENLRSEFDSILANYCEKLYRNGPI